MATKKTIKVREAVTLYKALKSTDTSKLPGIDKADLFAIIRATRALKATAEAQADFERDAALRLRPADYKALEAKQLRYAELTAAEQFEVTARLMEYERTFQDCIRPEQEKEVEIEVEPLSESAIAAVASASAGITMGTLTLICEILGEL